MSTTFFTFFIFSAETNRFSLLCFFFDKVSTGVGHKIGPTPVFVSFSDFYSPNTAL